MPRLTPEEKQRHRLEAAKAFVTEVSKIPAFTALSSEEQAAAQKLLNDPAVLEKMGIDLLASRDYNRFFESTKSEHDQVMADLRAKQAVQNDWWRENQEAVKKTLVLERENEDLKRRLGVAGNGNLDDDPDPLPVPRPRPTPVTKPEPPMDLTHLITKDDVARFESDVLALTGLVSTISQKHAREFDEILDTPDLLAFAKDRSLPLALAYDQYVAEKRETRRQLDLDARVKQAREEGFREGRTQSAAIPYPTADEANVFSVLGQATGQGKAATVAEMSAELDALMRKG